MEPDLEDLEVLLQRLETESPNFVPGLMHPTPHAASSAHSAAVPTATGETLWNDMGQQQGTISFERSTGLLVPPSLAQLPAAAASVVGQSAHPSASPLQEADSGGLAAQQAQQAAAAAAGAPELDLGLSGLLTSPSLEALLAAGLDGLTFLPSGELPLLDSGSLLQMLGSGGLPTLPSGEIPLCNTAAPPAVLPAAAPAQAAAAVAAAAMPKPTKAAAAAPAAAPPAPMQAAVRPTAAAAATGPDHLDPALQQLHRLQQLQAVHQLQLQQRAAAGGQAGMGGGLPQQLVPATPPGCAAMAQPAPMQLPAGGVVGSDGRVLQRHPGTQAVAAHRVPIPQGVGPPTALVMPGPVGGTAIPRMPAPAIYAGVPLGRASAPGALAGEDVWAATAAALLPKAAPEAAVQAGEAATATAAAAEAAAAFQQQQQQQQQLPQHPQHEPPTAAALPLPTIPAAAAAAAVATAVAAPPGWTSSTGMSPSPTQPSEPSSCTTQTEDSFPIPSRYAVPPGAEGTAVHFPSLASAEFKYGELSAGPLPARLAGASQAKAGLGPARWLGGIVAAEAGGEAGAGTATTADNSSAPKQEVPSQGRAGRGGRGGARTKGTSGVGGEGEEQLTDKQRRAREAQKRFREKQKARWHETEEALETTAVDIEREEAAQEREKEINTALEQMLQYKEEMLGALQAAGQAEALERGDPSKPPAGFANDLVEAVYEERANTEMFTVEMLQRYAVAGYTNNLDSQGRVTSAPPIDKVCQEFQKLVARMKEIIEEARQGGDRVVGGTGVEPMAPYNLPSELQAQPRLVSWNTVLTMAKESMDRAAHASAEFGAENLREAAEGEVKEVFQEQGGWAGAGQGREAAGGGESGYGEAPGAAAGAVTARLAGAAQKVAVAAPRAARAIVGAARRAAAALQGAHPADLAGLEELDTTGLSTPSEVAHHCAVVAARRAPGQAGHAAAGCGQNPAAMKAVAGREESFLTDTERQFLEEMLRVMLRRAAERGARPWALVGEGLLAQEADGPYLFTCTHLRRITRLLRQTGMLLWQQGLMFPDNFMRLSAVRIDTGQEEDVEEQGLERWGWLVEQLDLKRSQLLEMVSLDEAFLETVKPQRAARREVVEQMKEMHLSMAMQGLPSAQSQAQCGLSLGELNALLRRTVQAEHAAYCAFVAGAFRLLLFPLQKVKVITLSYPFFPQMHLIAMACAKKLGIDPPILD